MSWFSIYYIVFNLFEHSRGYKYCIIVYIGLTFAIEVSTIKLSIWFYITTKIKNSKGYAAFAAILG
ncbi:hypothetical protein, partial [Prevotella melaninogenica]|uniref:hypothetical protein n=1 Tax=Prevotella melaninogenica TaxID=28132 RepID=UPI001E4C7B68